MNNRRLEGVPEPIIPHEVATENYVDSIDKPFRYTGKEYLATHPINMGNRRLEGVGTPLQDHQAANKMYVDASAAATRAYVDANKVIAPALIGPKLIISVHAEKKGGLGNGNYEFSFGNGSSGREHGLRGYCMAAPGRIIRGTLKAVKDVNILEKETKINIVVNGIEKIDYSIVTKDGEGCRCIVFPRPLEIKQCDVINFITRSDNPDATNAYMMILI